MILRKILPSTTFYKKKFWNQVLTIEYLKLTFIGRENTKYTIFVQRGYMMHHYFRERCGFALLPCSIVGSNV